MREETIGFYSDGLKLDGTLYLPEGVGHSERRPAVVACSGYLGLNVIYPRLFAQVLTEAGYVVLGFDYRGNGISEGTPGRLLMEEQVRDIGNGLTFVREQEQVDRDRVALLGWGMGAGNVIEAAARDERARAVVVLNGFYNGRSFLRARHGEDGLQRLAARLERDRVKRVMTGEGELSDPYEVYPLDPDTRSEVQANLEPVPGFGPRTAFELLESILAFDAERVVDGIAPRPLFVGHGEENRLHPFEDALSLYGRAERPKTFYRIAGKHNDFMRLEHPVFGELTERLVSWLAESLESRAVSS